MMLRSKISSMFPLLLFVPYDRRYKNLPRVVVRFENKARCSQYEVCTVHKPIVGGMFVKDPRKLMKVSSAHSRWGGTLGGVILDGHNLENTTTNLTYP